MRGVKGKNAAVAEELSALKNVEVVEIDITNDDSVKEALNYVLEKYGRVDVLVNNAAMSGFGLLEAYTIDQIKNMFEVNFYGVIRTYQAVLPEKYSAKINNRQEHPASYC
jgi:NADP-dependent 3-hydroxy acid dehydrogenase YdfG